VIPVVLEAIVVATAELLRPGIDTALIPIGALTNPALLAAGLW